MKIKQVAFAAAMCSIRQSQMDRVTKVIERWCVQYLTDLYQKLCSDFWKTYFQLSFPPKLVNLN